MKIARFIVVALLLTFALGAAAQRVAENVQVTVVEVPVTVVDRAGNPVRNLTRANFELLDEGRKVPIDYFEVLDMKKVTAERKGPLPPAAIRNFLLLFDLANSSPGTIGRAADAAVEFVDKQLGGPDLAAVAVFTAESGARMITSFTNDKKMLTAAIRTLGDPEYFIVADPLKISFKETGKKIDSSVTGTTGVGAKASARTEIRDEINSMRDLEQSQVAVERNRSAQQVQNTEMKNRLRVQLSQMASVARVLDRLHGRKQVILLSEGFDARLVQGREELSFSKTQEESDAAMSGDLSHYDADTRYGSASSSRDLNEMTELFRRSDVVLHAIDIKGLRGNTDVGNAGARASNESLFLITKPTGGTVFKNANDLEQTFSRMLEQQEVLYLIGFRATPTGKPGKFHTLKIKTDLRGARLTHRTGYYESSPQISDLERTLSLAEIMLTDAPIDDVSVSFAATTLPGPGGKARVPVVVELAGPRFLEGLGNSTTATANLFLYAFDKNNQVVDHLTQKIALDLTKAAEPLRKAGIRYYGTLRLPPGHYAVKAVVRIEESGRVGFVRNDLAVPAFDAAVVMPPLFFADQANWIMLAGPSRGDDYAYPFVAGEAKYVPRSRPALEQGTVHKVALFLYRVPVESLGVTPIITGANGSQIAAQGQVKLLGRTAADERGSVKLLFDFKPDGLAAGDYELKFTVTPKDGSPSVVALPFKVL